MVSSFATFCFYAELNDFLPGERRQRRFSYPIASGGSIKDAIEGIGVPHTEVDLILWRGEPVGFAHPICPGDEFSVYPAFHSIDISPMMALRPGAFLERKFILDVHLGKLSAYMRVLGFDADYDNGRSDEELVALAEGDQRILLTRDRGLLKRASVMHGYCIRSTVPSEQLLEVVGRFDLLDSIRLSHRCVRCNGFLSQVAKSDLLERLPERTILYYDQYWMCESCGQPYWRGSHYRNQLRLLALVQGEVAK